MKFWCFDEQRKPCLVTIDVRSPDFNDESFEKLWSQRRVALTAFDVDGKHMRISTVILAPQDELEFETMILDEFGKDSYCDRTSTIEDALEAHVKAVQHFISENPNAKPVAVKDRLT